MVSSNSISVSVVASGPSINIQGGTVGSDGYESVLIYGSGFTPNTLVKVVATLNNQSISTIVSSVMTGGSDFISTGFPIQQGAQIKLLDTATNKVSNTVTAP